jgi:S-disulfanyl-L-cysteine oxidoreductase SoxD
VTDRGPIVPQGALSKVGPIVFWTLVLVTLVAVIALVTYESLKAGAARRADPGDPKRVERGGAVYVQHCAACHGAQLEGQPNWQSRLPNGRMPAPPHDAAGHTWHHPDAILFGITKHGLVPGKYAPPGYQSDMPAFGGTLSDEAIAAVLAYIKSRWPREIQQRQIEIDRNARAQR